MPDAQLPRYQCHKKAWALKIADMSYVPNSNDAYRIVPVDCNFEPFMTKAGYLERVPSPFRDGMGLTPETDRGYYVLYEDGYESWSPSKAFEEGYTRI